MVVYLNRGTPIYYNPSYGDPQKGTPNFGKPHYVPDEWDPQVLGFGEREGRRQKSALAVHMSSVPAAAVSSKVSSDQSGIIWGVAMRPGQTRKRNQRLLCSN